VKKPTISDFSRKLLEQIESAPVKKFEPGSSSAVGSLIRKRLIEPGPDGFVVTEAGWKLLKRLRETG
jgi:hypothetical protein